MTKHTGHDCQFQGGASSFFPLSLSSRGIICVSYSMQCLSDGWELRYPLDFPDPRLLNTARAVAGLLQARHARALGLRADALAPLHNANTWKACVQFSSLDHWSNKLTGAASIPLIGATVACHLPC